MRHVIVDEELKNVISALSGDEFERLEANILADGKVRDPLILWGDVLIDGHNRWAIIQKHPEIPYTVEQLDFKNRDDAVAWICRTQLGRRNLSPKQRKYLIGRQYEAEKRARGEACGAADECEALVEKTPKKKSKADSSDGSRHQTRKKVADEAGVSESYVRNAAEFYQGTELAEELEPGAKDAILSGKSPIPAKFIQQIPKMERDQQEEIARFAARHESWLPQAVRTEEPTGFDEPLTEKTAELALQELDDIIQEFMDRFQRSLARNKSSLRESYDLVIDLLDVLEGFAESVREKAGEF